MLVSDFVPAVTYQATGKVNSFVSGSVKWLKIIALGNMLIGDWQDEPDVDWASLALPNTSIGTVTTTSSFTLPSTVRKISNQESDIIRILHSDGTTFTDYSVISVDRQKDYANGTRTFQNNYIVSIGQKLVFARAFATSDAQYGGTITVPAYGYAGPNTPPNYLIADSDVIPVDIPNWLVYATAAQYDSTDVTRQQLVPRLEAKANEIMQVMKDNNDGQLTQMLQPWTPGGMSMNTNGLISDNY